MINFTCHKCSEKMEAPESLIGQYLKCPKCGISDIVPKYADVLYSKLSNDPATTMPEYETHGGGGLIFLGYLGLSIFVIVGIVSFFNANIIGGGICLLGIGLSFLVGGLGDLINAVDDGFKFHAGIISKNEKRRQDILAPNPPA